MAQKSRWVPPGVIANVRAIKQDKILTHQYVAKDDRLIVKFIVGGVHECNRAFSGMLTDFAQLLGILSKFSRVALAEIVPNCALGWAKATLTSIILIRAQ
jgi:hypothetical protein